MARLVVRSGKESGTEMELAKAVIIGRGDNVGLRISDTKASREHCRVFQQGGAWVVVDLNSRNGISVNGAKTTRRTLQHGDRIAIGLTTVEFEGKAAGQRTGDVFPASKTAKKPAHSAAADKRAKAKEKAFAAARADAQRSGAGRSGSASPRRGKSGASSDDGPLKVSDQVLQFSKIDARKGGLMDYDIAQMSGGTKALLVVVGLAIVGLCLWGVTLAFS